MAATPNTGRPAHGRGLSLRGLAVAATAAFALGPAPAVAVTQLNSCADLTTAGETYVLTADVSYDDVCFRILADRITLDLGGHTVTGPGFLDGRGVSDLAVSRVNTVVRNGTLTDGEWGIFLFPSIRTTVRNITVLRNSNGMLIGTDSLVKDCIAQRNVFVGIEIGSRGQIENCVVGDAEPGAGVDGNDFFGIVGGQRVLVTRTTANGNGDAGIVVGMRGTVSHSTASNNGEDGIVVGQNSLLTRNTTNDNGGDGIEAVCPSTITHNTALDNGGLPINPPISGNGCVVLHNTTSDGGSCLTGDDEQSLC